MTQTSIVVGEETKHPSLMVYAPSRRDSGSGLWSGRTYRTSRVPFGSRSGPPWTHGSSYRISNRRDLVSYQTPVKIQKKEVVGLYTQVNRRVLITERLRNWMCKQSIL